MALTDTAIRNTKASGKPYKLFDGDGLFLLVKPNGSRLWRLKYRIDGREKLLSVGTYPEVPLKTARERRDDARRLVAGGIDPSAKRKAERAARADTLEAITREWLDLKAKSLSPRTHEKRLARFEAFVFPYLGKKPIRAVTVPDLFTVLKRVEGGGRNETAHRVRSETSAVFRYAVVTGRADRDPAADLRGALAPVVVRNHPALTDPMKIGELLRAIDGYQGQPATEAALKLAPLLFVRPGELRAAEWSEFDLEAKEPVWRIPAERMKMREQHLVPLSAQAVVILKALHPLTGTGRYLLRGLRDRIKRPVEHRRW